MLGAVFFGLAQGAVAREVAIPVAAAREAAVAAVQHGDLATAQALATHLLAQDPNDPLARQVLAMVALRQGDLPAARLAARAAFDAARSDRQRHEAAKLAAVIADKEARGLALRWWLRAAGEASPTAQDRKQTIAALDAVRDRSPWEARLSFSLSPSNNVNGGAESPFNIIDGRPEVGLLNGDAQALSGMVGTLNADLAWRLARSEAAQTRATLALDLKRVAFSDAAKAQAETLTGHDLGSSAIEIGLEHERLDGSGQGRWDFGLSVGLGQDGDAGNRMASARVGRSLGLGPRGRLTLGAEWTVEQETGAPGRVQRMPRLSASTLHLLEGGGRLGFALSAYDVDSDSGQRKRHGGLAQVSYAPGQPLGPFDVSAALGVSYATYPDYRVGFIAPAGGRQDQTLFGQVTLVARDVSWQGFSPQVTLRASRSGSNISKFDTTEIGVAFGLKSRF